MFPVSVWFILQRRQYLKAVWRRMLKYVINRKLFLRRRCCSSNAGNCLHRITKVTKISVRVADIQLRFEMYTSWIQANSLTARIVIFHFQTNKYASCFILTEPGQLGDIVTRQGDGHSRNRGSISPEAARDFLSSKPWTPALKPTKPSIRGSTSCVPRSRNCISCVPRVLLHVYQLCPELSTPNMTSCVPRLVRNCISCIERYGCTKCPTIGWFLRSFIVLYFIHNYVHTYRIVEWYRQHSCYIMLLMFKPY